MDNKKNILPSWIRMQIRFLLYSFCFYSVQLQSYTTGGYREGIKKRHEEIRRYYTTNEDLPETFWGRKYLTGDWWGARVDLANKGVTISSSYVVDALGNPIGGRSKAFKAFGSWGMDVKVDLEKQKNWPGWWFYTSIAWNAGGNLSRDIDNAFLVQQTFTGTRGFKFVSIYLRKEAFDGNFDLKFGRLVPANDFITAEVFYQFVSAAFNGNPIGVFYNVTFFSSPNATWGALLELSGFEKRLSTKWGVYNINNNLFKNRYNGLNFTFKHTEEGIQLISEWKYHVGSGEKHSLRGNYRVGAYYYTGQFDRFLQGDKVRGNYSIYAIFDQTVYRVGENTSITPFIAALVAPKDRNTFPFFVMGGIVCTGPIPSRPNDTLALGTAYGRFSSDLSKSQRIERQTDPNVEPQAFECVIEATYNIQVNQWFSFQPDVQYVINPNGFGTIPNAFVAGFQIGVNF